jgi:type IV secretory pathway VirB2 component (pilin)
VPTTRPSAVTSPAFPLPGGAVAAPLLALALFLLVPGVAHAQGIQIQFIQDFGCSIVQWLKGPLAILIFILVCVATLVIGMITKMDWARIISVCVIFGILISIGSILGNSSAIQNAAGMSSCLQ